MKKLIVIMTLSLSAISTGAMGYSLNGNTENGFVLKCNDGTSFKSSVPPNHNTCSAKCEDHGGIAAGYPKPLDKASPLLMQSRPASPDSSSSGSEATNHNASRSNRSSR